MDKQSFILYSKQKAVFNALENDKAGELIKSIFEYVETKEIPKLNPLVEIAFIPIKTQLDDDSKKYEETCKKNRENAEMRWNKNNATAYDGKNGNANDADNDNEYDIKTIINNYFNNKEKVLKENFMEFLKIRKKLKAKDTPRAIQLLLNDLEGKTFLEAMMIIDKSIKNSWKGLFPLSERDKQDFKRSPIPNWFNKEIVSEKLTDLEKQEFEELLKDFK
jgi:5-hydroxyisourate hydrolase-like protein (transthyretin family)